MAEDAECFKNKKLSEYKESVKAIGNSWIICRSQSHSGRIYYFNTLTGKSAWNLSDAEIKKAQLLSKEGVSVVHVGDCPEPSEPPVDTPHCSSHHNVRPEDATAVGARIYNKQIINNQFSKPYAIPAFQNTHCHCGSLNTTNETGINVTPVYNPAIWAIPPHQVLLASAMANQVQPIFYNPNIPVQNTLPNCLHIGNQAPTPSQNPPHFQGFHKKKNNKNGKWNQNSQRNFQSYTNNDLRDILSARRKDQRSHLDENHGNEHAYKSESEKPKLTSDDIDEEWLEANAIGDISRAWKECSDADCWIVVASAHVMLNNRKLLSKFIKPEEQIFLLTPLEVLKQLRSATGDTDGDSRLVQRARCALRFAAQQMDKVPAVLKHLQNHTIKKCCLELVEQNYHVLLLLDDNELSSEINIDGIRTLTINQLKEYLNQKFNTEKPETLEKITVTICHTNGEKTKTISHGQSMEEAHHDENMHDFSSVQHKEIEIQTEYMQVKKTVDACIQTDFVVPISTEILQSPVSNILKSPATMHLLNTDIPKAIESPEIDQTIKINDIVKSFNENKEESNVATKKIKLKRNNISKSHSPVKKPQFRWRKQRSKPSMTTTPSPKECVVSNNHTFSSKSTPSSLISISDLLPLQNDNFSDLAKSIEFSDASIEKTTGLMNEVIEESSVDVISNSIDDDIIPTVKKKIVLNELKDNEKEEIVMFEVTSDLMGDYLSRGCDEWLSRFVQIMEECLTQVLQQEPSFFDPVLPPPWSVYEATTCIKKKFEGNSKIVFACNECCSFLLQISDSRGKIFADLNPSDFMHLYSYGVYLIKALQSLLKDSEDLQIANESLAKLLGDIKNPNLDLGQNVFMDTFLTEEQDHSANISELVTDAGDDLADAANISPPKNLKQSTCEPSTSKRYNLRSSQICNDQNENKVHEDDSIGNVNIDEAFFTTLRLQKTSSSTDIRSATPFTPPQTCLSNYSSTGGIEEITKKNDVEGPKIIRKNYYENEFIIKDNLSDQSEDICQIDAIGVQILKFVVDRTTYPVHRVLTDLHGFCEDTYKELNSPKGMDQLYKKNLTEKVKEVHECLFNLRNHLKSVLCRKDTKTKVRIMLEELGFMSCEISDTHVAEYGDLIQKYVDQADILSESVNLIAAAIRETE